MDVKLRVRNTRLFNQVAKVVGKEEAYREILKEVLRKTKRNINPSSMTSERLIDAFNWENSIKGRSYWEHINDISGEDH